MKCIIKVNNVYYKTRKKKNKLKAHPLKVKKCGRFFVIIYKIPKRSEQKLIKKNVC